MDWSGSRQPIEQQEIGWKVPENVGKVEDAFRRFMVTQRGGHMSDYTPIGARSQGNQRWHAFSAFSWEAFLGRTVRVQFLEVTDKSVPQWPDDDKAWRNWYAEP